MRLTSTSLLLLTLLFTLALAGGVFAAPMQDVSVTSVDLSEEAADAKGNEHLYVTVTRTDDLVDDDGSLLAERVMAVRVTFDVVENQLRCNGVPVEIGVSNIQVEAQVAANPDKLTITSDEEAALLQDSFDIGLATVEVTATVLDELKTEDGDMTFRRLSVQEKITEINGEQVVQTEAGQQILDVFENGVVHKWSVDPLTGFLLPGPVIQQQEETPMMVKPEHAVNKGCASALIEPMVDWWNAQSSMVRGLITGGFCALFFAIALGIHHLIVSAARPDYYNRIPVSDSADDEQIWHDDKKQQEEEEKRPFLT